MERPLTASASLKWTEVRLGGSLPAAVCPWSSSIGVNMNCGFDSSAQSMLAASSCFFGRSRLSIRSGSRFAFRSDKGGRSSLPS